MSKGDIAKENFLKGYNCSTAVVLSFKDEIGLDEKTIKKMAIGFGGGLGRQRLTCGAVSGMCMALSLILSDGEDKQKIYAIIQKACADFKREVGSLICGELLDGKINVTTNPTPDERNAEYYKKRPCADLCKIAGDIVEKYIKENN